jgi:hypothetical protein
LSVCETAVAGRKLPRYQDLVSVVLEAIDQTGENQPVDQTTSRQGHGLVGRGHSSCDLHREVAEGGVETGRDPRGLFTVEHAASGGCEEY